MMRWTAWSVALAWLALGSVQAQEGNWYERSFLLLHEDHHTSGRMQVGRDADADEIDSLLKRLSPDMVQIHAKGNPGWTTYPSKIGYTPPELARDVLGLWRDLARRNGFHWSIYYNIGRDGEIMRRHPEWNRDAADGREIDKALCYHSGVAEEYIWPMLDEIVAGYDPDGFWFDGSVFTIRICYCQTCRERFRKERNEELPTAPGSASWHAFHEMQRQVYREFIHETCRRIHQRRPDCLVSFNWAYSLRMPEKPDPGIAYLTGDIGNHVEGLSAEAHWYDGTGVPFDLMTTGHTFSKANGKIQRVAKPKAQLGQEMAIIIANGGRFNLWDNPSPTSRIDPEIMGHLAQVATPFLRERQAWCMGTERVPDVSFLHGAAAHYSLAEKGTAPFARQNNRVDGIAESMARLHVNYELVGDWRLEAQDVRSPLLIAEHPRALSDAEAQGMLRFAEGGGSVLLTGMGITVRPELAGRFGVTVPEAPSGPEPLDIECGVEHCQLQHHLFRLTPAGCETLLHARTGKGEMLPLLTRQQVGKGALWYLAIPFFSAHGECTPPLGLKRAVLDLVLPREQRLLVADAPLDAEIGLRKTADGRLVYHVVNMAPGTRETLKAGKRKHVTIRELPPVAAHPVVLRIGTRPKSVTMEPGGQALAFEYGDGKLSFTMPETAVHAMAVVVP